MKPKSIAVIGASGLLGNALMNNLLARKHHGERIEIVGTYNRTPSPNLVQLDIDDFNAISKFLKVFSPKIIFLSASICNVDLIELNQNTNNTNVWATQNLIEEANNLGIPVVYFSSGYVFDGKKQDLYSVEDVPNPINEYGRQKLSVEQYALQGGRPNLVIRTSTIFGNDPYRKSFAYRILDSLHLGNNLYVPNDQITNPISSSALAEYSVSLALSNQHGIAHIAGNECVSKFAFACRIAHQAELDVNKIFPITTSKMNIIAKRPKNCCLSTVSGNSAELLMDLDYGIDRLLREYDE